MKRPDPRLVRAEKLLVELGRLLGEIRDGVPPPRPPRKQRRRYKLPSILAALAKRFGQGRRIRIDQEAVLELIRRGAVIKASPPERGMPRKQLIDRERREHPHFNEEVRKAIAEARRRRTNRHHLAKLSKNAAWTIANSAVPRTVDRDILEDFQAARS